MRGQKGVLIAALLVLLLGGGLAVYWILTQDGRDGGTNQAASVETGTQPGDADASRGSGATDSGNLAPAPDSTKGAMDPSAAADTGSTAAKDATNESVTPTKAGAEKAVPVPEDLTAGWPEKSGQFVITGMVTFKADDQSAPGAIVSAEPAQWDSFGNAAPPAAPMKVEGSAQTDGGGEFTLRLNVTWRVPPSMADPGTAVSHVSAPRVRALARLAGYAPARSAVVTLVEGKEEKVTLALAIPAAVSGRVIDAVTREGIEGAKLDFYSSDFDRNDWTPVRTVHSAKEGYFAVSDLPAGSYMCGASAQGYAELSAWQSGKRVDLGSGGEKNLGEIALLRAGKVTGAVVDAATGEPVTGATVELKQGGPFDNWSQHAGVAGEGGRFEISDVSPGQYQVEARAAGYAPAKVEKLVVDAGKTADAGTVKLGRGFTLEGIVSGPQGAPVPGATVTVSAKSQGMIWGNAAQTLASSVSDEQGRFSIGGMTEGEAKIDAAAPGFARHSVTLSLKSGMAPVQIRLETGTNISGRVVHPSNGPAAGVTVGLIDHAGDFYRLYKLQPGQFENMAYFGDGAPQAATGEDGRFTLANVPRGTYLLVAVPSGGKGATRDNIRAGERDQVELGDIMLPGPGNALVTVTEGGQPVVGLKVELRQGMWPTGGPAGGAGDGAPAVETDGAGAALFRDVNAGEYYVSTARDKDAMGTDLFEKRRLTVRTSQTTDFKLELRPADSTRLHGRMTIDGKARFTEFILLGYGAREGFFVMAKALENGFYEFNAVPPGTFVLHARVGDKQISCMELLTLEGGEKELNRDFAVFALTGAVTTPANNPEEKARVRVSLQRQGEPTPAMYGPWLRAETRCDADGKYRLDSVPAGSYRLTASLEGVGSASRDVVVGGGDLPGLDLALAANSGTLRVTVKKINGALSGAMAFGFVQVKDAAGHVLDFENNSVGFFSPAEGAKAELPTIPAGVYTVIVNAGGCLPLEKPDVEITKDNRTDIEVDLTVAAELQLTVTNAEVTQAMLDGAKVSFHDAQGAELALPSTPFDAWMPGDPKTPEKPTLRARYIGPAVKQVRVKVQGYAELSVAIEFEAGKKIEKTETLVAN